MDFYQYLKLLATFIISIGINTNLRAAARITQEVDVGEYVLTAQETALLDNAKIGNLDSIKKLVAEGVNINCQNKSDCYCNRCSDDKIFELNIFEDLSAILDSNNFFTPLMLAAKYGHAEVVQYLLTVPNINLNYQIDPFDRCEPEFDAAHIAAFYDQYETFILIVQDPRYHPSRDLLGNMIYVDTLKIIKKRYEYIKKIINSSFIDGISKLIMNYVADDKIPKAEKNYYYAKLAIDNLKENINLPSPAERYIGNSVGLPILLAATNRCSNLDCELIALLLNNKFLNVNNTYVETGFNNTMTPLMIVANGGLIECETEHSPKENFLKIVKLLTSHKDIDINKDVNKKKLLTIAYKANDITENFNIVKYLLNFLNLSSKSVTHLYNLAIKDKNIEVQKLTEKFFERKKLVPLLFNAIKSGDEQTVRALIKKCPLKIYDDKTKDNPLHLAVEYGNANIIKLIFSVAPYLADLPNKDNLTPIDLAVTQPESLAIFFSDPIDLARCLKTTVTKENSLIKSSLISSASSSSTKTDVISALLKANLDYKNSIIDVSGSSKKDNDSDDSDGEKEIQQAQKKRRV